MKLSFLTILSLSSLLVNGQGQDGFIPQHNSLPHLDLLRQLDLLPHLRKEHGQAELLVDGKPFLMTAGELGNSSASSVAYMQPIWPKLEALHLNTVLTPVLPASYGTSGTRMDNSIPW